MSAGHAANQTNQEENLVTFRGVNKQYGDFCALRDAAFTIRRGDVLCYVGKNGAGKTTTIRILAGLISDFTGEVHIGPHRLPRDRERAYSLLGYLPQSVAFHPWRSVGQAMRIFGRLSGMADRDVASRTGEVLELFGIADKVDKKIGELSGGTQQKVGLAQSVLHRPELLVLDEPLVGLDPPSRFMVKRALATLKAQGTTIFFSSHILSDVSDVATRIAVIDRGSIVFEGSEAELRASTSAEAVTLVELSHDTGKWSGPALPEGVSEIAECGPGQLRVRFSAGADPDAATDALIRHLMGAGCRIRSVRPETLGLEELFLRRLGQESGE